MTALLFTVDAEEFDLPAEYGLAQAPGDDAAISRVGYERLLGLLHERGVVATHFATALFADAAAGPIREALVRGHELALHAWSHRDDCASMTPEAASARLSAAKRHLEANFSVTVRGYRANRFRSPARAVLRDIGLQWTSNLHPTWVPGSYNHFRAPRCIHMDGGLLEVPISVTPVLRLPLSWFWLRNFGWSWFRACVRRASAHSGYLHLYVHPWEFTEHAPLLGLPLKGRLSLRRSGTPFLDLVARVLRYAQEHDHTPQTISAHLRERGYEMKEACECC
ncbi:MAG: DUF3473 domain-containing protein [Planctomycetes bacterium]|nr:DUF3473 domain-containing protein [Planctomycetota bacterium]